MKRPRPGRLQSASKAATFSGRMEACVMERSLEVTPDLHHPRVPSPTPIRSGRSPRRAKSLHSSSTSRSPSYRPAAGASNASIPVIADIASRPYARIDSDQLHLGQLLDGRLEVERQARAHLPPTRQRSGLRYTAFHLPISVSAPTAASAPTRRIHPQFPSPDRIVEAPKVHGRAWSTPRLERQPIEREPSAQTVSGLATGAGAA